VVILSGCGAGTDALATSYAGERGLHLVPYPLDYEHHPFDAPERRNARLAADADAVVVVWDEREPVRRVKAAIAGGDPVTPTRARTPMRTKTSENPDAERALRSARRLLALLRGLPGVEERRLTQLAFLVTE
jgi:hypothetical protein